jgi:hypothetical protein
VVQPPAAAVRAISLPSETVSTTRQENWLRIYETDI